jgi:hypothetical protein
MIYTSSPVLVTRNTSTSAEVPVLLETRILRRTRVADEPAVRTLVAASVIAVVTRSDFVSILKVFAIST